MTKFITRTILLIVLALALIAGGIFIYNRFKPKEPVVSVTPGRISRVEEMVRLCTMEIYSEVPVLDTINRKVIFAVQKQTGSIYFDVSQIALDTIGDTVRITLPPPIVEVREATVPKSWEVIDTKGLGLFVSDRLTIGEENTVKKRIQRRARARLYSNGSVAKAREEAASNLKNLLEAMYRKPVEVIQ